MSLQHSPRIVSEGLSFSVDASNPKSLDGNENLLTYSQQLDNSEWNKTGYQGLATVTTNSIVAPDGTQTAETLHFAPAPNQSRRSWFAPISLDGTYTVSAHVKKGDMSEILLYVSANVNPYPGVKYNFDTDTVTPMGQAPNPPVGIPTTVVAERTLLSDGWVRISATSYTKATLPYRNETAFIGMTTGYTYAWGVQLEKRSSSSTYYETTDTSKVASAYLTDSVSGGIGTFVSGAPAYNSDNGDSIVFTGLSTVGLASNTHVDFPDDASLRLSNTFSISSWFYWDGINQESTLFSKRNGSNPYNQWNVGLYNNPYSGGISNNLNFFGRRDDHQNDDDILLQYALPEAGWYNVAVSVSPSQQALYVNGIGRSTSAMDIVGAEYNIPGKDFYIGHAPASSNAKFDGKISSVQIYKDKALTAAEVLQNYDVLKGRYV